MLLGSVGAHQAEAPVGPLRAAGPDLLAVDQPVVATVLALGLQRGQVRAGAGLGKALAPADLAAGDGRDMALFLRLAAVFQQGRPEHHHAHAADGVPGPGRIHLLLQDARLGSVEATAAIGLWPGANAPAGLAHRRPPYSD